MYAQLNQSYQWNRLNQDGKVIDKIQKLISSGVQVTFDRMPTALSVMRNRIKSPIFNKLLDAIKQERLVLLYNDPASIKVPGFLPFVLTKISQDGYVAVVFLELCEARLGDGDEILVNERKLKVVMESAYIALQMLERDNIGKLQSANIVKPSSKIYSYIIAECINRKYNIKMDQNVFNTIIYLVSKFFIRTTLGCTSNDDIVENYCMANCKEPNPALIHMIADDFEDKDFEDISTLITKMVNQPDLAKRIGKMNVSSFTESYINMYDVAMLLAMENFPYLVFNIISVSESTYINNYYHLKGIIGDEGKKLYATLITTIC